MDDSTSTINSLDDLRATLSPLQQEILNTIWRYEVERNKNTPLITICGALGKTEEEIDSALSSLRSDILYTAGGNNSLRRLKLSYLGYLLTERGQELEDMLVKYLNYVRTQLRSDPETEKINVEAALSACQFSPDQRAFFKKMFFRTPFHGSGSITETGFPPHLDTWFHHSDLRKYLHEITLGTHNSQRPQAATKNVFPSVESQWGIHINSNVPTELAASLERFRIDHPDPDKVSFLIMRFGSTPAHVGIQSAVETALRQVGMTAVRADEKQYHDDLFSNILTYLHGCGSAIAVFERLEEETFNPNVSLEVGYMLALRKPVCLLKDKTLKTLHTDLMGKIYKQFDPQNPMPRCARELIKWLSDKGLHRQASLATVEDVSTPDLS